VLVHQAGDSVEVVGLERRARLDGQLLEAVDGLLGLPRAEDVRRRALLAGVEEQELVAQSRAHAIGYRQLARLDPAARVTISKFISERIFLTYSRSLSSSTRDQVILLELDQTDQLSWILSRNEDGTYALDLRVRRTF